MTPYDLAHMIAELQVHDERLKVANKHLDRIGDQLETIITLLSPASMPEDATEQALTLRYMEARTHPLSPQGDPVLDDVRGRSEDCDHDWPPELDSEARCIKCGLAYNQWSVE